jgi:NitT/TauT family transport system substrate-binding protein
MRNRLTALSSLLLAAALLSACGDDSEGGGEGGGGMQEISVGVIPILDVAPIYLGIEQGFFEDRGLDVTLETAQGGAAIIPAVVSGQQEFGFSNNTSLLLGQAEDLPVRIVAPGSSSTSKEGEDFAGIVVPGDSDVKSAADLAGKSVAINTLNNISDTVVRESVRQDGGNPENIDFVELAFPDMPAAVQEGRVDAAFVVEPFLAISEGQGARDIASAYAIPTPDLSVATYFTSEQMLQSDPETVDAFREAMIESQEYASENPDEVRQIITTYTEIDEGLVEQLTLPAFPSEVNQESIQVLADLAQQDGLLSEEADVDALIQD